MSYFQVTTDQLKSTERRVFYDEKSACDYAEAYVGVVSIRPLGNGITEFANPDNPRKWARVEPLNLPRAGRKKGHLITF